MKSGEVDYMQEAINWEYKSGLDPESYRYELLMGRGRYKKIVANSHDQSSRRAVAFIDKLTGQMFVASGWSQPARTRIA